MEMKNDNSQLQLVAQAINGDMQALNILLDKQKNHIYAIAFALLKNKQDAEDAMQQTLITVWQSIGSLENPAVFDNWLYRITYTRSLNILKARKNKEMILENDIGDIPQAAFLESELMLPQAYAERNDLRQRLFEIIDSLSAVQRETIVLHYFHDKSVAEIAQIMECSPGTVKSRLYLARNTIRTEIEAQEKKSGEKFFGVAVGMVPIGKFVSDNVSNNLLSPWETAQVFNTARRTAFAGQAVSTGHGAAQAGKSAAAAAAKRGVSTAVKIAVAAIGTVVVASVAGIVLANVWQQPPKAETAPATTTAAETTAVPTTQPDTAPTTAPTTQAPTEPDYTQAYKAYKGILEENGDLIQEYKWQFNTDGRESRQVAFADIMGDKTPELIYVYGTSNRFFKFANLIVYTYSGGKAQLAFSDNDDPQIQSYAQTYSSYMMFQTNDDKHLYYTNYYGTVGEYYKVFRLKESNGRLTRETIVEQKYSAFGGPSADTSGKVNQEDVGYNAADIYKFKLFDKMSQLIMYSDHNPASYQRYLSFDKCIAMTYANALSWLDEQTGTEAQTVDYSAVAATYSTTYSRHYRSVLTINKDGTFINEYYFNPDESKIPGEKNSEAVYSLCRGRLSDYTQTKDYTYIFKVTDITYDYPVGESGDVTYTEKGTTHKMHAKFVKNPFETGEIMTLYAKGTKPSNMNQSHFTSYVFPENPKTSARATQPTTKNMIFIPNQSLYVVFYEKTE